jgi:poly(3-hydroxybutyrate) depolymerase
MFFLMQSYSAIIEDHTHYSAVMRGNRNYRVFLPPDYFISGKRYPVIYWFHGSGESSKQDTYKAEFDAYLNNHDMIIVNVDGTTPSRTTWD